MAAYVYPLIEIDEQSKRLVWDKGRVIPGFDPNVWRWGVCGHVIRYADHADTKSGYGWEIDHIYPRALGGKTTLDNLQPLFWETNRRKGDNYPWSCN